jgi:hypothetical protein
VTNGMTLEQVLLRGSSISPADINPPLLHTHLLPSPGMCDSPYYTPHYFTLSLKSRASFLINHLAGYKSKEFSFLFSF